MYWYVFFTKTGYEKTVELYLKARLNINEYTPFIPMIDTVFKCSGEIKKERKPLFPGYVFIKTEISDFEFILKANEIVHGTKNIIKLLRNADTNEYAMQEDDKILLTRLCNDEYCVESSIGIIVGTCVYIEKGSLMGLESIIRKIDRHKQRAIIELDFMGAIRQINVGLEIVEVIK